MAGEGAGVLGDSFLLKQLFPTSQIWKVPLSMYPKPKSPDSPQRAVSCGWKAATCPHLRVPAPPPHSQAALKQVGQR